MGVWGTAGNNVYVSTSEGRVFHYDGATWTLDHDAASAYPLQAVWGSGPGDVYAVGGDTIVHYDGVDWTATTHPGTVDLWGVWGSASDDVFATGSAGSIQHYPYPEAPGPFTDCNSIVDVPVQECEALVAFWNDTNGPSWVYAQQGGWLQVDKVAPWRGVRLTNGHVTELNRRAVLVSGTLPDELGNLTQLQLLNVEENDIGGPIPSTLGNLADLERLHLGGNALDGSIPATLGNLSRLELLDICDNQLTGAIPPELGNLAALTELYLNVNQLTGSIPTSLGNLTALTNLLLNNNQLSGGIPAELGYLTMLQELSLSSNPLGGGFPAALGNLTKLFSLDLWKCQLTGPIPDDLGKMTALTYLKLSENQLSGAIPSSIGKLALLEYAYLQNNQLSGQLPQEIGLLGTRLREFDVRDNLALDGPLPHEVINLENLFRFDFSNTQICVPEHPSLQQWAQLAYVTSSGIVCPRPAGASLLSGHVLTSGSVRVRLPGVLISDGGSNSTTTDKWGQYALFLPAGTHNLTASKRNWRFGPSPLAVTVPPDATEGDFAATPLELGFATQGLGPALAPGSTVIVSGTGFLEGSQATVSANTNTVLGQVTADAQGEFAFILDTTQADPGTYYVSAKVNPEAIFKFTLSAEGTLVEEQDATLSTFQVPSGIALHEAFLPLVCQ